MNEGVRWVLGFFIPALIGYCVWATHTILRLKHTVYGDLGKNGLKSDMLEMKQWREEFRAELPGHLRKSTHDAVNKVMPEFTDLDLRIRELERRR